MFALACVAVGEPARVLESPNLSAAGDNVGFLLTFALLICSGCLLTFSQFLCAAVCSAVTTSLVGVAKSVLQTSVGFFTFGGVRWVGHSGSCPFCLGGGIVIDTCGCQNRFSAVNVAGICLNTLGACTYSYVKYRESSGRSSSSSSSSNSNSRKESLVEDVEANLVDRQTVTVIRS